jgi:hypothetical protein
MNNQLMCIKYIRNITHSKCHSRSEDHMDGVMTEASAGNLFAVFDDMIYTHPE